MSTQKYIDAERGWIDSLLNETPIVEGKKVPIEPVIDIDPEIEKEIALIQEAKFSEKIDEIKLVKEPQSVEISDELGSFFTAIAKAKTDLTEKIEKEEVKIAGLEELFDITYLVTLGVIVTLPSIRLVIKPPLVVVVKSHTYRPSVSPDVTVSVSVMEQVPSVPLTIAVVKLVEVDDK